jgi:hypothetical protein
MRPQVSFRFVAVISLSIFVASCRHGIFVTFTWTQQNTHMPEIASAESPLLVTAVAYKGLVNGTPNHS